MKKQLHDEQLHDEQLEQLEQLDVDEQLVQLDELDVEEHDEEEELLDEQLHDVIEALAWIMDEDCTIESMASSISERIVFIPDAVTAPMLTEVIDVHTSPAFTEPSVVKS